MHETECLMAIKYMISVLNRDSTMLSEPSTKNVALGSSGLFHFAILVPDRYSNRLFLEIISGQIYLSSQNLLIIFPALSSSCLSITIILLR